jgi:peptide/nickel transport system permease protein
MTELAPSVEAAAPELLSPGRLAAPAWTEAIVRSFSFWRMRIGFTIVVLIILIAIIGPFVAPHGPGDIIARPYQHPSAGLPLGADYLGEDVLSRVLWGGRTVVWMSAAAATIALFGGGAVGLAAGYSRSWLDDVLMRTMDVLLALPALILTLTTVSLLGPKLWLIVLAVGWTWIPAVARLTRSVTLEVVRREHIQAAEAFGLSPLRICLGEVLPNIITPLMVDYGLRLTWAIGLIAALSFLGLGIQPPNADWGLMINQNQAGLTLQVWSILTPVLLIGIYAFGVNMMTEGLGRSAAAIDRRTATS